MSDTKHKIIIAVDGFSSCGKSTFAKAIARRLGYIFIDTGAMYRAVTLYALEHGAIRSGIVDEDAVVGLLDQITIVLDNSCMTVEQQMAWFMTELERINK